MTLSLSAADNTGGSGLKEIRYTTDGTNPSASSTLYSAPFTLSSTSTLKYGAYDKAGNVEAIKTFQVKIDKTAPTVVGVKPAAEATDVSRGTNVVATFSEKMQKSTLTKANFKLYKVSATGPIQITNGTVTPNLAGTNATLDPYGSSATQLAKNTRYKAVVTTGVKDLAANALASNKVWFFRTVS